MYSEVYRPQFHFTPPRNWMNDPNGLVYFEGEYHLFYQHNPFGLSWDHMSWGHAVSPDLVHWEHLPVALAEEDGVMVFSGGAVVDWDNTSGLGVDGKPPLVAIYTGHRLPSGHQAQYVAFSTDRGRTWTKYAGNPVLDRYDADFRDPKVFWHAPSTQWVMVVSRAEEHTIQIYGSPDLLDWTLRSEFGPAGDTSGFWECPDLFELPLPGDPTRTRWVLQVDVGGGLDGDSGTQYFVGDFDGATFTTSEANARPVDHGKDFFAAASWSDIPAADGRRIWIGWMNQARYALSVPTSPWRGTFSVPREVTLREDGEGVRLAQVPIKELHRMRGAHHHFDGGPVEEGDSPLALTGLDGRAVELVAEFEPGTASELGLKVRVGQGEETVIGYDATAHEVSVDRRRSGVVDFDEAFPGKHTGPLHPEDGRVRLHVFLDWSCVEVFAGNGQTVITDLIFPNPDSDGLALYATGGTARLVALDVWEMESAWDHQRPRV